jgi:predicted ATPase/class 3 adenylate cyclase
MGAPPEPRAFAMADIAGSARLWNRFPDRMSIALARHDARAHAAVGDHGGEIFKHTGDGFLSVFTDAAAATAAMIAYQGSLTAGGDDARIELRSRVGIHFGSAEPRGGDWFGPTINQLARLTDLVAPTHVVMSGAAADRLDGLASACDHLGDFALRDSPDPVSLYAARLDGAIGPALTVAAGRGLPHFRTELVGRDADIELVLELLGRRRLVTVVGFGGMGKTRLAVAVARRWSEDVRAPASFVDLSATDDPMVGICEAIGIDNDHLGRGRGAVDAIADRLGRGPALLVVDNCEHVIDAAASTCITLIDAVPGIRILATSREALELDAEVIVPLEPLSVDSSVRLLRHRASALGSAQVPELLARRLCERVDGMPLGIELVAARLRQVDPAALADMLDENLDELRTRRRRGPEHGRGEAGERHATMRSLVAWSYALLSEDEKTLLLRLSQLPAPWPGSAATHLSEGLEPNRLDELVAKSLVMPVPVGQFRMLEPIRHFCDERLADDAFRLEQARRLLVDWAHDFVPEVPDDEDPVFDPQGARRLLDQIANLRTALAAATSTGRHEEEAEILLGLWPLTFDGRARAWFGPQIDETLSRTADPGLQRILIRLALQDTTENFVDLAREEHLVTLLRAVDPDHTSPEWGAVQASGAVKQIIVDRVLGIEPHATRQLLADSVELARSKGRRLDAALAQLFSAHSYLLNGEYDAALGVAEQAAEGARRVNFEAVAALADATGAMAMQCNGEFDEALEIAEAAVPLAEHARWETSVRTVHALLLGRVGRVEEARAAVARIIDLALSQSVPFVLFDAAIALAAVRATERDLPGAAAAMDLAGVGRTPLTIAVMFEVATEIEFEVGLDRFAESLDPEAVVRRAERAAGALRRAGSTL